MAIVRRKEHRPEGRKEPYVAEVKPLGYPDTAVVCGVEGCDRPGKVWLRKMEYESWRHGETVFKPYTNAVRIRTERFEG